MVILDTIKKLQGIKEARKKIASEKLAHLDVILRVCPTCFRIIKKLNKLCGYTEGLTTERLHFANALENGIDNVMTKFKDEHDVLATPDNQYIAKLFIDGVRRGLVESQQTVLASADLQDSWDCLEETSFDFFSRNAGEVAVLQVPVIINENAKEFLAQAFLGLLLNRADLQLYDVPSIGRSQLFKQLSE